MNKKRITVWLYYRVARWLPRGYNGGGKIRYAFCKRIFKSCGKGVNIEKGASFGLGYNIEIGDFSGIGVNAVIPDGSKIGNNVMMGPNCFVLSRNHKFDRTDIPMRLQGYTEPKPIIIDDDVWIGQNVTFTIGRHIYEGTVVAANSVVTKDFPPYSVIGGNPAKLIKMRR